LEKTEELFKAARKLRFPGELETEYREQYDRQTAQASRLILIVAYLLVSMFMISDLLSFEDNLGLIITIRVLCNLPLLIFWVLSFFPFFARITQFAAVFSLVSVGTGVNVALGLSDPADLAYSYYFSGVTTLLLPVYTLSRLRFYNANITAFLIIFGYEWTAIVFQKMLESPETIGKFFMINIILIGFAMAGAMTCYLLEHSSRRSFLQQKMIEQEVEKSDQLLLNIMPRHISNRLKEKQETIADSYDNSTVLFADIVGFTALSKDLSPITLVKYLNEIFSQFDDLTEKYGLEKIKTIGDAYMVASIGEDSPVVAARKVGLMALEMLEIMERFSQRIGTKVEIRIGINSGPLVAGVIGKKKFIYDLWGDTVNTASRMESQGVPGEIQVTESTYAMLQDAFVFEDRGLIELKGKGSIPVYLLKGKKEELAM
jgi:class 3 adenylate cyclase